MHWYVVHVAADPLGAQRAEGRGPVDREKHRIEVVGVPRIGADAQRRDLGRAGEEAVVARGDGAAARDAVAQLAQLARAEGALEVGDAIVEAELHHLVEPRPLALAVVPRDAVVAENAHAARELRVVRRDHAALAGRDVLYPVPREHVQFCERAYGRALVA